VLTKRPIFRERGVIMEQYLNLGGNSNVKAYSIGQDYIDVVFGRGARYRYSYRSAGIDKVEQMKMLARKGVGLNSYIMRYAKMDYEK
jgi:hypothetical protein